MDIDKTYINICLFSLKQILGTTFPNPPVFSILLESSKNFIENKIVSHGFTSISGRPHAEANVLNLFKPKKNKIYTLYSTLEPCCHVGREESCVSKIIKSKFIKRVVFCINDPDHRVNGRGKKLLIKNGIKVRSGLLKKKAIEAYKGYILNRKVSRPKVYLKLAVSMDGFISRKKNTRSRITNKIVNKYNHIFRSEIDAILVGSNTLKIDNCFLTCRAQGLEKYSPIRVILNSKLDLDYNLNIFNHSKKYQTIIFTSSNDKRRYEKFLKRKVQIKYISKSNYNLRNILKELSSIGVLNLIVEGGGETFSSFFKAKLFDEIYLYRGNCFFKNKERYSFNFDKTLNSSSLKLSSKLKKNFGNNTLEILHTGNKLINI